jgi:23S rRNA pseudouridine2605 synthase
MERKNRRENSDKPKRRRDFGKQKISRRKGSFNPKKSEEENPSEDRKSKWSVHSEKFERVNRPGSGRKKPWDRKNNPKGRHRRFENSKREPEDLIQKDEIRLNKYIASSGICSRRDADKLIEQGLITVNGKVVTQMGTKIKPGDVVRYGDENLSFEKYVYVLMNKPKDVITSVEDPQGRMTVLDILSRHIKERIYPVGRLDRQTTGLLLLTNDGDLAKRLTHPKHGVSKIYQVTLNKAVTKADMAKLIEGIELEDGVSSVDSIGYTNTSDNKKEVNVRLHSGKNRIIRRMFEALGYKLTKLDRVSFAGLTKKNLLRGKWRFLTPKEAGMLKMIS